MDRSAKKRVKKSIYIHLLHLYTFTVIYCVCNTFNTAVKHIGLFIYLYLFIVKSYTQYSLTHSLLRLTSEGRSDLHNERSCADASRLFTRDRLPPVSRSSLAGQVDASSRGQGICPARGWHSGPEIAMSSGRHQKLWPISKACN